MNWKKIFVFDMRTEIIYMVARIAKSVSKFAADHATSHTFFFQCDVLISDFYLYDYTRNRMRVPFSCFDLLMVIKLVDSLDFLYFWRIFLDSAVLIWHKAAED